ncbi:hypothetical protein GGR57DRAFT_467495 [Xylariaceae sp. FL1272]|nr:hypothetical protein GGR57DRAFT_467495 [Xylariaceae sp. FL1272]
MELSEPRNRTMPLVPELFKEVWFCKQAMFLGAQPVAEQSCRFCPNLNFVEYREPLSDEKKDSLDERTRRLQKRAQCNQLYQSSEFGWEVTAWHDVFGAILYDESMRMDKRPYEYVERDEKEATVVKQRIPDATLGLRTYDDYDMKHGYRCDDVDCKIDHSPMQPDRMLQRDDLSAMMHDATCGLVVDGVWGKTSLVFPFAVYEAKKRSTSDEEAERQIYHACRTYLAMLDDLARNPNNVAQYQTNESSEYQLFAFTSCGSSWQAFMAWKQFDACLIETIWKGDIRYFKPAFELICIVDQIHDYATRHHRPFVIKHLAAWHAKHQETLEFIRQFSNDDDLDSDHPDDPDGSSSVEPTNSAEGARLAEVLKPAKWLQLKEETRVAKRERAFLTRQANRRLRELAQVQATESQSNNKPKRGRGRPRKTHVVAKKNDVKRKRGRPPKTSYATSRKGKGTGTVMERTQPMIGSIEL